jgi:hypothetical protein
VSARPATLALNLSSPSNLSTLIVGQTVQVNVSLTGLGTGEKLVSLTSGVDFPSALLGTPTGAAAGAIVPNPLADPLDFQTTFNPGQADAVFATFSTAASKQIIANGLLYSFQVTAQSPGSGAVEFSPLALLAEQFDPTNPTTSILRDVNGGASLNFTVSPALGTAAPLPSSLCSMVVGLAGIAAAGLARRAAGVSA